MINYIFALLEIYPMRAYNMMCYYFIVTFGLLFWFCDGFGGELQPDISILKVLE